MFIFLIAATAAGQSDDQSPVRAAVKTTDGVRFIWNQPGNNFTLDVKGRDVRPNNSTTDVYFKVDSIVFQIQSPAIAPFMHGSGAARPEDGAILTLHREWESQYLETILGKLSVESKDEKLADGRRVLVWKFDIPEKFRMKGKSSIFLTTVNGDHVIVLGADAKNEADEDLVRRFLLDTMTTLKVSPKPFELPKRP